jgi:hypothetical protein
VKCWAQPMFGTPCKGRMDPHHLIKQQKLRALGLPQDDPRILRVVCRAHHERLHSPHFHLWKTQLPASVLAYAREYCIEHVLDTADTKRRQTNGG